MTFAAVLATSVLLTAPATAQDGVSLALSSERVELVNGPQKVLFDKPPSGRFVLTTQVRTQRGWEPLFDAGRPVLAGEHFNLYPTAAAAVENSAARVAVLLSGAHEGPRYDWTLLVEAKRGSPLVHFRVVCRIREPLILAGLEPQSMLWMKRPKAETSLSQGPGNIYFGDEEKQWGNSFPAAWLWTEGKEAAIFYDMGPMDWMSHRNLYRFHDCHVQAFSQDGVTGLGLRVVKRNFHEVPAGELVFDFYLYAGPRAVRPTRLEALDTLIHVFADLHPATAPWPENRIERRRTDWRTFAEGTVKDLMLKDVTWADIPVPGGPWRDGPLFPERTVATLRIAPDYAVGSSCLPQLRRTSVQQAWDFSGCNNALAPWIAWQRLYPDPRQKEFLDAKVRCLPLFYDPKTRLFRHSPRDPAVTDTTREMAWQNFTFPLEVMKVQRMLPPEDFDPALAGKFLMSTRGLIELAHNVDYIFPQWFDPRKKSPLVQGDVPELGIIREPWQAGTYAYLMCLAYEMTQEKGYLDEARTAVDRLFGGMTFSVTNPRYSITYKDPVDFPVTEIFGNAWGVAAAQRLHRHTGQRKYLRAADDFRNVLLRMTYWYESNQRDDPQDRFLHNAGLFRNHGGAMTGSPWETVEAYLPLTLALKDGRPPMELLLRLFNLQRINGFYFYPPVFGGEVTPGKELLESPARYLPIENFYMPEHGGKHGSMGRCVYMSSMAIWNHLLYEALAESDDREVMVLCLDVVDGFEEALAGAARNFIVYNPTEVARKCRVRLRAVPEGEYHLNVGEAAGVVRQETHSSADLAKGTALDLAPRQWMRLRIEHAASAAINARLILVRTAQHRLARAYQLLQEAATGRPGVDLKELKTDFTSAVESYRRAEYRRAADRAQQIIEHLAVHSVSVDR
jgi:hypothetical protein